MILLSFLGVDYLTNSAVACSRGVIIRVLHRGMRTLHRDLLVPAVRAAIAVVADLDLVVEG